MLSILGQGLCRAFKRRLSVGDFFSTLKQINYGRSVVEHQSLRFLLANASLVRKSTFSSSFLYVSRELENLLSFADHKLQVGVESKSIGNH